jgi:thiamine pyrophosphate-dependent acetolactate synthase large subunit-like protein
VKAAELFVKALENEGVTHVFGVPGEENLDVIEALRHSNIRLVLTRHEQAAALFASSPGSNEVVSLPAATVSTTARFTLGGTRRSYDG